MSTEGLPIENFAEFRLTDHIRVVGASLKNGLLNIDLHRELPEALKPRTIEITS